MFGMTRGEIALVAFIFALSYGALLVPRWAERLGRRRGSRVGPGSRRGP